MVYTLDGDFNQGTLLNLSQDIADQLQLNDQAEPFPYINIACSARGTMVRIDISTGDIVGEYWTSPDGMGKDPSRTTVDNLGNVWVANRNEFGLVGGQQKGSVTRIALVIGGTRCNADGTPNPTGQYLKPPFLYNTAVDRDNDGLIKTSLGLGNILPWNNAGSADSLGGVSTAEDECIINYTRVEGIGTRHLSIDSNNNLWVGGLFNMEFEQLDGVTGQPIAGTFFNLGCGGYGGLMDCSGIIWSARSPILRYDTNTNTGTCIGGVPGAYGMGIDPNNGHIWVSELGGTNSVYELDPSGAVLNSYPQPFITGAQGLAVDANSHVWVAEIFGDKVAHYAPDPSFPGQHVLVGVVTGFSGTTGIAVDTHGKIWAAEISGNQASRIDPAAGAIGGGGYPIGAIDLQVDLGIGAGPYNYSDMTGFVALGATSRQGSWDLVHDSGTPGMNWGAISWNASEPAGTEILFQARAADTEASLSSQAFVTLTNNSPSSLIGQYIEVLVTLKAGCELDISPILYDLTIAPANEPPVAVCDSAILYVLGDGTAYLDPSQVDGGSYDLEDGTSVTLSVSPDTFTEEGIYTVTLTVTDSSGLTSTCEALVTVRIKDVPVDIKPTSCPNPFNLGQKGLMPVAILGTADLDVSLIDVSSIFLEGVAPIGSNIENLNTVPLVPYTGKTDCMDCMGVTAPDAYPDLTLKFDSQELANALGNVEDGECRVLHLTGIYNGLAIEGEDVVRIMIKK